jgi:hypothetical protein
MRNIRSEMFGAREQGISGAKCSERRNRKYPERNVRSEVLRHPLNATWMLKKGYCYANRNDKHTSKK